MEVKIPTNHKGLRIRHFDSVSMVPEGGFKRPEDSLVFLAEFTGLRYNQLLDFTLEDICRMTITATKALAGMDLTSALPDSIVLGGKEFYKVDPEKAGIGWHIDFSNTSIKKDPVRLACLFYLPKGFKYSDVDENGNITHPIASRKELFEQEFPLDLFIRSANFFLKSSLVLMKKSMVKEIALRPMKARERISSLIQVPNLLNGKNQLKK